MIPAEQYTDKLNGENAELYPVFPYKQVHLGKEPAVGVETFRRRVSRDMGCWRQDPIQAAMLGLADEAREYMVYSFTHKHDGSRFPAF